MSIGNSSCCYVDNGRIVIRRSSRGRCLSGIRNGGIIAIIICISSKPDDTINIQSVRRMRCECINRMCRAIMVVGVRMIINSTMIMRRE